MHEYFHHFVVACNTRVSAALGELALVIPRCETDQLHRSLLPTPVRLWNLLLSRVLNSGTLSSFKSAVHLCIEGLNMIFFLSSFPSLLAVL